jgi:hypothetical protein
MPEFDPYDLNGRQLNAYRLVGVPGAFDTAIAVVNPDGTNISGGGGGGGNVNLIQVGGAAIALGQTTESNSLPVTIASNQSAIPISASSLPLPTGAATAANQTNGTQVTSVNNFPATQTVAGTVAVSNFPSTTTVVQPSGSNLHVDIDNFPATQPVSGTVSVSNFPATQTITGTVTANAGTGTFAVSAASLPLPTGAATAANQTTTNTTLSTISANQTNGTQTVQITNGTIDAAVLTTSQAPPTNMLATLNVPRHFGQVLTTTPLGANATYTSAWFDTNQTGTTSLKASSYSDQASASGGFSIQVSNDSGNTNFTQSPAVATTTASANTLATVVYSSRSRYWRIVYTNGPVAQTSFEIAVSEGTDFAPVEVSSAPSSTTTGLVTWNIPSGVQAVYQETTGISESGVLVTPVTAIANVAASQTNTVLIAGTAGKKIRVLQLFVIASAATSITFSTTTGNTAISPTIPNAANGGEVLTFSPIGWFDTNTGDGLECTTSSGGTTGILLKYVLV